MVDRDADAAKRLADEIGGYRWSPTCPTRRRRGPARGPLAADVLVNNAGLQHVAPLRGLPAGALRLHPAGDAGGAVPAGPPGRCRTCTRSGWGRVVNISSVHGLRASPFKSAYVTAKHGLEGLSKVVALEGAAARRHLATASTRPTCARRWSRARSRRRRRTHGIAEAEVVEKIMLTSAAIKRLIEPDEVAELVAYLCTAAAAFITGASIAIDGGWTAH